MGRPSGGHSAENVERGLSAHQRAEKAARRATDARVRVRELAEGASGGPAAETGARQRHAANLALLRSVDSRERAARAHDDAARLYEQRGEEEIAAAHRERAAYSRAMAAQERRSAS